MRKLFHPEHGGNPEHQEKIRPTESALEKGLKLHDQTAEVTMDPGRDRLDIVVGDEVRMTVIDGSHVSNLGRYREENLWLVMQSGHGDDIRIPRDHELVVGRDFNEVRHSLPETVSRLHFSIIRTGDSLVEVRDRNSKNGTEIRLAHLESAETPE